MLQVMCQSIAEKLQTYQHCQGSLIKKWTDGDLYHMT